MEWVRENWFFILFFIIFIAMHLSGHGCMGGHGKHGEEDSKGRKGHGGDISSGKEQKGEHRC